MAKNSKMISPLRWPEYKLQSWWTRHILWVKCTEIWSPAAPHLDKRSKHRMSDRLRCVSSPKWDQDESSSVAHTASTGPPRFPQTQWGLCLRKDNNPGLHGWMWAAAVFVELNWKDVFYPSAWKPLSFRRFISSFCEKRGRSNLYCRRLHETSSSIRLHHLFIPQINPPQFFIIIINLLLLLLLFIYCSYSSHALDKALCRHHLFLKITLWGRYWVGQKVLWGFSAPSYGKTWVTFWGNPLLLTSSFDR